nr:hypothetical protein Iba_chr02cCG11940 [Ipomoea batatas]
MEDVVLLSWCPPPEIRVVDRQPSPAVDVKVGTSKVVRAPDEFRQTWLGARFGACPIQRPGWKPPGFAHATPYVRCKDLVGAALVARLGFEKGELLRGDFKHGCGGIISPLQLG